MKIKKVLRQLHSDSVAEIFFSGEYARDILRRKHKKLRYVEVMIRNLPLNKLATYFRKHYEKVSINKKLGTIEVKDDGCKVLIRLPKSKQGRPSPYVGLREDARNKFFTINSLYIVVDKNRKRKIVDIYHGRKSIRERKIKTIGKADLLIKKHPIVMPEAIALAAKLNYRLDNNLFYSIKANHALIKKAKIEDIRDRLCDILLSDKPSRYLKIMQASGLLYNIMMELSLCDGVTQNTKYHKYNVFEHLIYACDNTPKDIILRLAALLHDVGKPQTREERYKKGSGRITFYNHEVVGSRLARRLLRRLRFDKEIIDTVSHLVYNHMYNYEPEKWTEAAVRRFIKKVKLSEKDLKNLEHHPLFMVRRADRAASGSNLSEVSPRQKHFQRKIKEVYNRSKAIHIEDLEIDGNKIMKEFNLKPGPTVGHVLKHLLSRVIEDQSLNNEKYLMDEASKYLSEALK